MFHRWQTAAAATFVAFLFGSTSGLANIIQTATVRANCTEYAVSVTGTDLIKGDKYKVKWYFGLQYPDGTITTYNAVIRVHADDQQGDFKATKGYEWSPPLGEGTYSFAWGHATLYDITDHQKRNKVYITFDPPQFTCPNVFNHFCMSGILNYGAFELGGGEMDLSLVTINGSVAVAQGGTIDNMAPSTISGNVYEYNAGQYYGPGHLNGTTIVNPGLMQRDYEAAEKAASEAAALTANDGTYATISSATTITGGSS